MIFDQELLYSDKAFGGDVGNRGVLLSYGEGKDYVPVGTFVLSGFVKPNGEFVDVFEAEAANGCAMLEEVTFDKNDRDRLIPKKPGNKIILPASEYRSLFFDSTHNNDVIKDVLSNGGPTPENAETISEAAAQFLADIPEVKTITKPSFKGITLEEAEAILLGEDNKERGTNYRMYPFDPAKVLELVKELEHDGPSLGR